jgi:hypothetical protein
MRFNCVFLSINKDLNQQSQLKTEFIKIWNTPARISNMHHLVTQKVTQSLLVLIHTFYKIYA